MKRSYLTLIITMLVVGFAAVSANLILSGTLKIGFNNDDFNSGVVFSYVDTITGEAFIDETGKNLTFSTDMLLDVNQESTLDFDIANKSEQYDADVELSCQFKDNSYQEFINFENTIDQKFKLEAGKTKSGTIIITLIKPSVEDITIEFTCSIIATASERTDKQEYIPVHPYKEALLKGADPVLEVTSQEGISLAAETNDKKLIPVIINADGTVTRADITQEWYNYKKKEWANAVILADGVEDPGANASISEEQIESYFVWIPKYRYKIFDMGHYDQPETKNYQEKSKAIEIEFGLSNTKDDESKENYKECATPGLSGDDGQCHVGDWMTHPAFTAFEGIKGMWVGKFETGYKNTGSSQVDASRVVIKPNVNSWTNISLGNSFKVSKNYKENLNSHMMKNTEWGAVAYLTHSIYGRCASLDNNITCEEVTINSNSVTGYSNSNIPYLNKESVKSSTTSNYTGIYDMSGGAYDQVASIIQTSDGSSFLYANSLLDAESLKDTRYYDIYKYNVDYTKWSRRILGDATGELGPFIKSGVHISSYLQDYADFVDGNEPFFYRGGSKVDNSKAGVFSFAPDYGGSASSFGFRVVLSPQ